MQTNAKTARPGAERKRLDRKLKKQAPARKTGPQTAQQTIPYREIFKDGICRVNDKLYTKSMEYEDINYQLAQADDQSAIFDGYCAFLNSFDSSLPFQLSFINHRSRPESKYKLNIPMKEDGYSDMRREYALRVVNQVKDIDLDDGVSFEVKDVSNIMDEMEYPGIRVTMNANVGRLITPLKIDISTGDVITPRAIEFNYDLLLEDRSISL